MSGYRKPMTIQGKSLLEKELKHLIEVERPKVISAIEVARGHGDLSENADYSAAKERQAHIEGRIATISDTLSNADVVDTSQINSDKITFGAYVRIEEDPAGKEKLYQIVGEDEADVNQGKISINSPLARSLIGRKTGEEFEFHSPGGGEKLYHILEFYFK
ncbi:MAG: transcription elongation factor GreA [Bdellovibrionales bacterium]|nr:transcription elongation factor GreA [Bdellovibrionales bacterium]